jgi:hypothetical protein
MAIYRELFFNNLLKLLSNTFPVLKRIHDRERWRQLVRLFMIHHRAQTPYFLQIPKEFIAFLDAGYPGAESDFPFLRELAHYEWIELELSVSTAANDMQCVQPDGDLLDGVPVMSQLARQLSYRFPVHRISVDYLPAEPGDQATYLAVYRDASDEVGFMELNPVTARLLQLIDENEDAVSGRALLLQLADELGYPDVDRFIRHGADAMRQMRQTGIVLGTAI